jgi:hypothetical protein
MFKMVLLGLVISHGAILVAMERSPDSPRILEALFHQKRTSLNGSAELRLKGQESKKKTAALLIVTPKTNNVGGGVYYKYPGSHSPVEYLIPADYGYDFGRSDCP